MILEKLFADASEPGYAAYVFIRLIAQDNKIAVTLLATKLRVTRIPVDFVG